MGILRLRLLATGLVAGILILTAGLSAAAQVSESEVVEALEENGRYLEFSDNDLDASITRANSDGIAFAWIDSDSDGLVATSLAEDYTKALDDLGSRYRTVVVLLGQGFGASSSVYSQSELDAALDASVDSFAAGSAGRGLETFRETVVGSLTTATTAPSADGGSSEDGGGIGFGSILAFAAVIGGGFLGIRAWIASRRRKKQATSDMEDDRAEIKEQLKNNADRVITLGDRAIASGDHELITTYESASATYQDVSQSIDTADTPEAVDALDDRIDHAEWQFEVIEAKLEGRPKPPSPAEAEAAAIPPPEAEQPAPDPEEPEVATSPRTGRRYPTTSSRGGQGRPSGGLGGILGSILGGVLGGGLGGGLGGNRSRRSQRRSGGFGIGGTGTRSAGGGGLGGGVLRRGGKSGRSRPSGRSRSRSTRGGRSFGGSKSRGGRNF